MESLLPEAQSYLEALRSKPYTPETKYRLRKDLDRWHGYARAQSVNPLISSSARLLYVDKAKAIEILFKELDVIDLLQG